MRRLVLFASFLLGPMAVAADPAQGEVVFQKACGNCHTAAQYRSGAPRPPRMPRGALPHVGPDLAVVLHTGGVAPIRRWVRDPWAVRSNTACDPRLLPPNALEDLLSFLSSRTRAEPPRHRRASAFRRGP